MSGSNNSSGIDPRERYASMLEALRTFAEGQQSTLWTALPGIIVSFNATAVTATVQPAVKGIQQTPDLKSKYVNLPVCPDVPVIFPHGGGYSLTFPVAAGDECLLVFASRNIDNWWAQGGVQQPFDRRQHDLSDAFAILGPYSQAHKPGPVSTTGVELRNNAGTMGISINNSGTLTLTASSTILLNAPTVVTKAGVNVDTHTHNGVQPGGGNTGPPNT